MKISGKSALVTGGAGFLGSFLVEHLIKDGWEVKVLDNLSTGKLENLTTCKGYPFFEVVIGDLKDRKKVFEAVKDVEVVFHFAANPEVRVSTINPETHFNENILSTFVLLEAMRSTGKAKYLVFASSSSVYGEPMENPVSEDAPLNPVSVYGASKASCEMLIRAYSGLYGIRSTALRYANVVGPRLRHGIIYDFILKLRQNQRRLEILGDGAQRRSFIWVGDAVEATMKAFEYTSKSPSVYSIGNVDWITVKDVADEVVKITGIKEVEYVYKPVLHGIGWAGDVKQIMLDISRIRSLGWSPTMSSRECVRKASEALLEEVCTLGSCDVKI